MGLPGFEPGSLDSESKVLTNYTTGPFNFTVMYFFSEQKNKLRRPGIEPGPRAWKARILTIELSTLFCLQSLFLTFFAKNIITQNSERK